MTASEETFPENAHPIRTAIAAESGILVTVGALMEAAGIGLPSHALVVGGFVLGAVGATGLGVAVIFPARRRD